MVDWLSGWAKRVKITIDSGDIDDALENFPVLVYISASSGHSSKDISCVFDELTQDANRKKIAVTKSDGTTECYMEIEKWDDANEQAWLWVKVPDIASDADTDLYLYYDSTHADNDAYVGDPSDAVVHNVWDANFKLVTHMRDDPDTSHIGDSTVNANDGTKKGIGEPVLTATGMIGEAQDFDGLNDIIDCGTSGSLDITDAITIEMWVKLQGWSNYPGILCKGYATTGGYSIHLRPNYSIWFELDEDDGTRHYYNPSNILLTLDTWNHVVVTYDGAIQRIYIDTQEVGAGLSGIFTIGTVVNSVLIGRIVGYGFFNGSQDEVRISNTDRSVAWIKASYESQRDHLNDFGIEEESTPSSSTITVTRKIKVIFGE